MARIERAAISTLCQWDWKENDRVEGWIVRDIRDIWDGVEEMKNMKFNCFILISFAAIFEFYGY